MQNVVMKGGVCTTCLYIYIYIYIYIYDTNRTDDMKVCMCV
jgi:hypothetical protein